MSTEPRYYTDTKSIADLTIKFVGERYEGLPILDTSVYINDLYLCSITWEHRTAFLNELNDIILNYRI